MLHWPLVLRIQALQIQVNVYSWTYGDGGLDTAENPSHIYNSLTDTTFTVCLQVTDGVCKSDTCELVKVEVHRSYCSKVYYSKWGW